MPSIVISEERGVRYLHFGSPWVQGAMRLSRPHALELEYTRQMVEPLAVRGPDWPRTVLQLGLGAGSLTRYLRHERPRARIVVVEISEVVVAAARQWFLLPDDDRHLSVKVAEAHEFLAGSRKRFDLILVDAFDARGRSGMADSVPFYMNCRDRLTGEGIASFNLLTRSRGAEPALQRMRSAFHERLRVMPLTEAGNVVVLAGDV